MFQISEIQSWLDAAIIQGGVIGLVGLLALVISRRSSASGRHLIAAGTLFCMLLVSILNVAPIRVPVQNTVRVPLPLMTAQVIEKTPTAVATKLRNVSAEEAELGLSSVPIGTIVVGLYAFVAGILLLRLGAGLLTARRLKMQSAPADERLRELAGVAAVRVGLSQTPHLGMNALIHTPMAVGGLRQTVLLPMQSENWDEVRTRSILEHEMAHVKRKDCQWQFVACLVCALQWFNPMVWALKWAMVNSAEQAADDAVILSGTQPSEYASFLLESAKFAIARKQFVATVPLVRNQNLKTRIQSILSAERRDQIGPKALFGSLAASAIVAIFTTAAFAQDGRKANLTSWADDVRKGSTVPGDPSNDYTGTLRDGRKVQILQIAQRRANGVIVYWKPDGTPIDPRDARPVTFPKNTDLTMRVIVMRAEGKGGGVEPLLTLGSGSYPGDGPSEVLYAGGGMLKPKGGDNYALSYIGVPKEDGESFYFTAELWDDPWKSDAEISPSGRLQTSSTNYADPKVQFLKSDTSKDIAYWAHGYTGPYAVVELTQRKWSPAESIEIRAFDTNGNALGVLDPDFGDITDEDCRHRWYVKADRSHLGRIEVITRLVYTCEMNGIKVRPKQAP